MAASIRAMKIHNKRKVNELEDISNTHTHKKARIVSFKLSPADKPLTRLKYNNYVTPPSPPQQRSSPPADCLDDENQQRHHDQHPHQEQTHAQKQDNDSHPSFPATPPESINDESNATPITAALEEVSTNECSLTSTSAESLLSTNADYITLTSSLRLATRKSAQINDEIIELSKLQNYYMSNDNKEETVKFFLKLINNELHLPKPSKIMKSPTINWSKYHPALAQVSKDFENQLKNGDKKEKVKNSMYKALHLFDKFK